jgi:antitoxin component YwqK of YwqJK toxin-antitoxin module
MKTYLSLILIVTITSAYSQQLTLVKDTIMNNYMESGYSTKHFRPEGKEDGNGWRQGQWKDYEVSNDFAYVMIDSKPKQIFGNFLLYGEGQFVDNKREGGWKFYVLEDKSFKRILQKKVSFVKGEKDGPFAYYFPSGRMGIEGHFLSDQLDGEVKSYYERGQLYGTRFYENGLRTGRHTYLYPDGKLELEHNFTNDTLNGLYQSYYQGGKLEESFTYNKGLIDGTYKYYYDNGQLWVEKEYKNGLLMNVAGSFDRKGNQRDKGSLKDGNGTINFYTQEGKVYSVQTYKEGKKIKEELY